MASQWVDMTTKSAKTTRKRASTRGRTTKRSKARRASGMTVSRWFTEAGKNPLDAVEWEKRASAITNPDGSVVFALDEVEIPASWSQLATDIVVSKYFRKAGLGGDPSVGETSVRQVVERLALTIREAGQQLGGYFATDGDADAFQAELEYLLVNQMGAFNSPVWFNCGLWHRYGIRGNGGLYAWDFDRGESVPVDNAFERPQCSACFIQHVGDDLMDIYELLKTEARLFKYGSGTGTNFSALRGRQEKLSGGGTSSGLMSFLDVFDRAAGSTKSGGTTRRAAKMVCLDMDHPEIVDFIEWKVREEDKARALIAEGFDPDFNGEAYKTISGQNANNSVRVTDRFMAAVETGGPWSTIARTTGKVVEEHDARALWDRIAKAAWACADPGVQFDTTINRWHTCPECGRINASNPCSEYMFLDNSACNLASLNMTKFLRPDATLDLDAYRHAVRVFLLAQEILVDLSSYPTPEIAANSHRYRPLGLGYANLGTLLMLQGLPYDSEEGRAVAAAVTAIMTGEAYAMSAEMAAAKGPFEGFADNQEPMLHVMGMHRDAAYGIDRARCPAALADAACEAWDRAMRMGVEHGYRNAQATVLAPTGTIGLLMDCDTTGIEPDFALVKFKKLAGGGYFKIVNQSVPVALSRLGYASHEIEEIVAHVSGTATLVGAPHINRATLQEAGLTAEDLGKVEAALPAVFDLGQAFAPWVIGVSVYERLGVTPREGSHLLRKLGFDDDQIGKANDVIVGRMTIEGAPFLREDHLPVFDCANRCGLRGQRFLRPEAHVRMMAAVQPFLSGAISKTVNMPSESRSDDVRELYELAWRLGLKAVAIYRDGSKASQPLQAKKQDEKDDKKDKSGRIVASAPAEPSPDAGVRKPSVRVRLPKKRQGFTQEARVGGHKVYLRTGEYADGALGEIFIDMHKEGAAFRSLMNCFSMAVSIGLQHGVPLSTYVDQFSFTRFEPQGLVEGHPNVKFATSIVDYIFRVLGVEYLQRYDLAQVPPSPVQHRIEDPSDTKVHKDMTASLPPPPESTKQLALPETTDRESGQGDALSKSLDELMGDAPVCDNCGHITVRNGSCYRCLNCGNSLGCS